MANKIKVLIDSDVCNEVDDQFALAYALSCQDKLDILGITIAPYRVSWQNVSIRDGMVDGRNETFRILRLFGIKHTNSNPFVYMGCDGFLSEGYDKTNPAVEKIIQLAKTYRSFYVCCLGTLTNVAMALRLDPSIASKIKIIWLGTDNILLDKFNDSNYIKDVQAFKEVLASKVDFTIFPTYLGRTFVTSVYELSGNIRGNHIAKYLISLVNKFQFTKENLGIKTIYDIGPIAYLLHKKKFEVKDVSPNILKKGHKIRCPKDRKVHYIMSVPKHSFVWAQFLKAINSNKNHYYKPEIFFTSDTHFNQESKVRRKIVPFQSLDEMNYEMIRRWNNVVGPDDIVYHLGDFGDYDFVKYLNGKIILICGNYEYEDFGKNFDKFRQNLLDLGFTDVIKRGIYLDEKVLGQKVYLTHEPSKHAKDCITLFGHVHGLSLVKKFGFNVCVSYHYYTPITAKTAKRYVEFVKQFADHEVFS